MSFISVKEAVKGAFHRTKNAKRSTLGSTTRAHFEEYFTKSLKYDFKKGAIRGVFQRAFQGPLHEHPQGVFQEVLKGALQQAIHKQTTLKVFQKEL